MKAGMERLAKLPRERFEEIVGIELGLLGDEFLALGLDLHLPDRQQDEFHPIVLPLQTLRSLIQQLQQAADFLEGRGAAN